MSIDIAPTPLALELARAYCTAIHPSRMSGDFTHPKNETCPFALWAMVKTVDVLEREQMDRITRLLDPDVLQDITDANEKARTAVIPDRWAVPG